MDGCTPSTQLDIPLRDLEAQITELAGQLNAAQYRWLTLIAEFERRQGWADGSLCSCAHWLNYQCGLNLGAAREKVRVAHALKGLPKICRLDAAGGVELLESARAHAGGHRGDRGEFVDVRPAWHGAPHRDPRPTFPPCPGS